ncbi:hypothetical protein ACFOEY_20195 [Paracandidimonas soli]|uniref:hypothetical protein n=1 Tax=Paracandidimonas soli TaxID=1917182 RepID=UPI003622EE8E
MDFPKSVPGVGLVGGRFVNEDAATGQLGSLIPAEWGNSLMDELFAVFVAAGIEPEESDTTQLLQAIRGVSLPIYPSAPAMNVGPIVYALDRQQILHWQTIGSFTGYASPEVGKFTWGTSIAARPYEENAIGQTIDRTLPKYAALVAWAEVNGHMQTSGAWVKGAFHFASLGGNSVRMPDLRDQFIRATGTDVDTANARPWGLGSWMRSRSSRGPFHFTHRHQEPRLAGQQEHSSP